MLNRQNQDQPGEEKNHDCFYRGWVHHFGLFL
jgi:hypothetical protein